MRWRLPPPKALIALEAVVRNGSVTVAAAELSVTQSAVSKQISALESWVGHPLFEPGRRQMIPTPDARRLADCVGAAWSAIAAVVDDVTKQHDVPLDVIAPATFAMRWLLPRLPSFETEHPAIKVSVRQTHTPDDWQRIPFDVAIRRGDPAPPRLSTSEFLRERLFLVARRDAAFVQAASPAEVPLLESDTRPGELAAWLGAAAARLDLALAPPRPKSFAHFYIALEAVLRGQGALVAPDSVVADLVASGDLVVLFPAIFVEAPPYWVGFDRRSPRSGPAGVFASWLLRTSGDTGIARAGMS